MHWQQQVGPVVSGQADWGKNWTWQPKENQAHIQYTKCTTRKKHSEGTQKEEGVIFSPTIEVGYETN